MRTSTCKTCNQPMTLKKTSRGFRWAHPNGQLFCAEKQETASVPDWKYFGAQCPSEFRMTAAYANEVRHVSQPSENEDL